MTGGALEKYDWRRRLRGGGSGVYTPPCIGRVHDHVHGHVQVVYVYTVVYTDRARPWTRPVYSGVHDRYAAVYGPCTRPLYGRPNGRVRVRPCTPYKPCIPCTPCTRTVCTDVYTARTRPWTRTVYTAVGAVYGSYIPTLHGHGRVHDPYMWCHVYTAVHRPCTRHAFTRPLDGRPCIRA